MNELDERMQRLTKQIEDLLAPSEGEQREDRPDGELNSMSTSIIPAA